MRKFSIFSVAVMSLFFLQACGDGWGPNIDQEEIFIASGHEDWPPIMSRNGDEIVGAGPELLFMILNELGLNMESRYVGSWDIVQEKAKNGEIDMIVAAYKTPEREAYMDYTIAYTLDPVSIFVKKGNSFPFLNWDELVGKKGVVTKGDSYGQEFDAFIAEKLDVVIADSPSEAFALIISGEADYFVYAFYSGENALAKDEDLAEQIEILPNDVCAEDFYMTISKKSRLVGYLSQINQILQRLIDDGTVDELIEKNKNNG